jgi:hypothetical protein
MPLLDEGPLYSIEESGGVVTCRVKNRADVNADEGASSAAQMQRFLVDRVLSPRAEYLGLVFDVSEGPTVFGPRTRAALEHMFRAAAKANKAIVVRVGEAAIQRLQFAGLCRECAPDVAQVITQGDGRSFIASRPRPRGSGAPQR